MLGSEDAPCTQVFSAYFEKICEVEVVIEKLQTGDIKTTNRKPKMENETNWPENTVMRWIRYLVSLSSGKTS